MPTLVPSIPGGCDEEGTKNAPRASAEESVGCRQNFSGVAEVAYLLIALDHSTPAAVAREVRKVAGVVDVHVTMGEFDIIAVTEMQATRGFPGVTAEIQRIDGVAKVTTCVVVRP